MPYLLPPLTYTWDQLDFNTSQQVLIVCRPNATANVSKTSKFFTYGLVCKMALRPSLTLFRLQTETLDIDHRETITVRKLEVVGVTGHEAMPLLNWAAECQAQEKILPFPELKSGRVWWRYTRLYLITHQLNLVWLTQHVAAKMEELEERGEHVKDLRLFYGTTARTEQGDQTEYGIALKALHHRVDVASW